MRRTAATAILTLTVLAIVATTFALGTTTASAATPSASATRTGSLVPTTDKASFIDRINDLRLSRGLQPLIIDPTLASSAQDWTAHMAGTGTLAHDPGLAGDVTGWTKLAENVGTGSSVTSIWSSFVASPGHLANLVDPAMTHLGVGPHGDAAGRLWTTHRFMKAPARFRDAAPGHPFYEEIVWMTNTGLSEGFADGTFRPTDSVSRQAVSAWLYRLNGEEPGPFPSTGLSDVAGTPFANEIKWMVATDRAGGFVDGTFKPANCVTRQAMMAFLYREAGSPAVAATAVGFDDVAADSPFVEEIAWAVDAGIADGFADGGFHPGTCVSRQAAAAFLYRTFA